MIDVNDIVDAVDKNLVKSKSNKKKTKELNPLEKRKQLPTFTEKYEEELIKKLFEEELEKLKGNISAKDDGLPESEYFQESRELEHHHRDGKWDVLASEEIRYFDPELSYELTGYRPISMTEGLDFDPSPFCEAARTFEKNGKYTEYPYGCKAWADYWRTQLDRCTNGYTVGKYRITGDHYFFLNFYRMQTIDFSSNKITSGRTSGFPSFIEKQYEFFHYLELCEYLGKDCIMLKARGIGFSEILACLGVRPFVTTRNYRSVYTADSSDHLMPTLSKCWMQLNWLNMNTGGGMKRNRQKIDNIYKKRASLLTPDNIEFGRLSEIEGIIADNPNKVRGDRCERLIFEEAGSAPQLIKAWIQGNALVEVLGRKVGTRIGGGTGGDSSPNLAGLTRIFNNPLSYNVLPYKNSYSRDRKIQYTGFFIPAYEVSLDPKYADERGVTDSVAFKAFYEEKRKIMEGKDLMTYCAEHCFTPEEAILLQGDNIFDSEVIADRLTKIRVFKEYNKPEPTTLIWDKTSTELKVKAIPSKSSKLLVVEPPIYDENGNVYKNLYVAGIDAIDAGTSESATDYDVSDFCIIIKKRVFGMSEPKYVAMYKDRPKDIREAYEISLKLLTWYNCKAMLEYTKISIQRYFQDKKKGDLFMSRPEFATTAKFKSRNNKGKHLIGLPATEAVITHGLELISAFIADYCWTIDFDEMLDQLLHYSYEAKRKFDIVAALSMVEIADEELSGIAPSESNKTQREWRDFGYYRDENGHIKFGELPGR